MQIDERQVVAHRDRAAYALESHELGVEDVGLVWHLAAPPRPDGMGDGTAPDSIKHV
jgi:hypothetical protein